MRVVTERGTVVLSRSSGARVLAQFCSAWSMPVVRLQSDSEFGADYGVVFQVGDREAWAHLNLLPPEKPSDVELVLDLLQRACIEAMARLSVFRMPGVLLPCIALQDNGDGRLVPGLAVFTSDATEPAAGRAPQSSLCDAFIEVLSTSEAGAQLPAFAESRYVPRLQVGSIKFDSAMAWGEPLSFRPPPEDAIAMEDETILLANWAAQGIMHMAWAPAIPIFLSEQEAASLYAEAEAQAAQAEAEAAAAEVVDQSVTEPASDLEPASDPEHEPELESGPEPELESGPEPEPESELEPEPEQEPELAKNVSPYEPPVEQRFRTTDEVTIASAWEPVSESTSGDDEVPSQLAHSARAVPESEAPISASPRSSFLPDLALPAAHHADELGTPPIGPAPVVETPRIPAALASPTVVPSPATLHTRETERQPDDVALSAAQPASAVQAVDDRAVELRAIDDVELTGEGDVAAEGGERGSYAKTIRGIGHHEEVAELIDRLLDNPFAGPLAAGGDAVLATLVAGALRTCAARGYSDALPEWLRAVAPSASVSTNRPVADIHVDDGAEAQTAIWLRLFGDMPAAALARSDAALPATCGHRVVILPAPLLRLDTPDGWLTRTIDDVAPIVDLAAEVGDNPGFYRPLLEWLDAFVAIRDRFLDDASVDARRWREPLAAAGMLNLFERILYFDVLDAALENLDRHVWPKLSARMLAEHAEPRHRCVVSSVYDGVEACTLELAIVDPESIHCYGIRARSGMVGVFSERFSPARTGLTRTLVWGRRNAFLRDLCELVGIDIREVIEMADDDCRVLPMGGYDLLHTPDRQRLARTIVETSWVLWNRVTEGRLNSED